MRISASQTARSSDNNNHWYRQFKKPKCKHIDIVEGRTHTPTISCLKVDARWKILIGLSKAIPLGPWVDCFMGIFLYCQTGFLIVDKKFSINIKDEKLTWEHMVAKGHKLRMNSWIFFGFEQTSLWGISQDILRGLNFFDLWIAPYFLQAL
jgi:hypothetical protein